MKHTTNHILEFLEEWAPQSTKLEYDNVGLLVGDSRQEITRILVSLDVTSEVVEEAIASGADLIIAHHPLIFRKLSRVTPSDITGSLIYKLIKNDINLVAAHTNLDAAYGGVSFAMAERLGLKHLRFLKEVPRAAAPAPRPVAAAGNSGSENGGEHQQNDTAAGQPDAGFGVWGELPSTHDSEAFLALVRDKLESKGIRYCGSPKSVKRVAVCGGAGSFLMEEALRQHMDAFVTSDLKYHDFFTESPELLVVDAGHYESEVPMVETLNSRIRERYPEMDVISTSVNTNPVNYFF